MNKKILIFWAVILIVTIGFLLYKVVTLEDMIKDIHYNETQFFSELEDMGELDEKLFHVSNSISEIEVHYSLMSKLYSDLINQVELNELENQLDMLQKNNLNDIAANIRTLNMHMEILNKIIFKIDETVILHVQNLYDFESKDHSKMIMVNSDNNTPVKLEISTTCKFYIGSDYYRYETTLKELLTPQEPLESDGFTIIIINDVVEYILTGEVY